MNLLFPLGLLGLLGIAVLILIYILKPNYQQKIISSTYVWKLSLRYKRKRVPINRLRSILLLICQILIITSCAFILARPIIEAVQRNRSEEKIAVIDASANMLTQGESGSRFERAVEQVRQLAEETFAKGERLSVIIAGETASYLVQRFGADMSEDVYARLDALVQPTLQCSYGVGDIDGAMDLAEDILEDNPDAEVLLYTATEYIDAGSATVVDVSEDGEWNAAILDVQASISENYYTFTISVACYGRDEELTVLLDFDGVNYEKTDFEYSTQVRCSGGETQNLVLNTASWNGPMGVYSFDSLRVNVQATEQDSFSYDNNFYYYASQETIRIQYASSRPNDFFRAALNAVRTNTVLSREWNIEASLLSQSDPRATEGYDFYIYEEEIPEVMPVDGVVMLVNPVEVPSGVGIVLADEPTEGDFTLSLSGSSAILDGINPASFIVTQYRKVTLNDGFEPLLTIDGDPVMLLRNEDREKIVLLSFGINFSNPLVTDFSLLFLNLYKYFFPYSLVNVPEENADGTIGQTMPTTVFEVGDTAIIDSVGDLVSISVPDGNVSEYGSFPAEITLSAPGAYTLTQTLMSNRELTRNFYVKLPASESNIFQIKDSLELIAPEQVSGEEDEDLLLWFAVPLVALLFIEWLLQIKENF